MGGVSALKHLVGVRAAVELHVFRHRVEIVVDRKRPADFSVQKAQVKEVHLKKGPQRLDDDAVHKTAVFSLGLVFLRRKRCVFLKLSEVGFPVSVREMNEVSGKLFLRKGRADGLMDLPFDPGAFSRQKPHNPVRAQNAVRFSAGVVVVFPLNPKSFLGMLFESFCKVLRKQTTHPFIRVNQENPVAACFGNREGLLLPPVAGEGPGKNFGSEGLGFGNSPVGTLVVNHDDFFGKTAAA